jgi:hypothetical protein
VILGAKNKNRNKNRIMHLGGRAMGSLDMYEEANNH